MLLRQVILAPREGVESGELVRTLTIHVPDMFRAASSAELVKVPLLHSKHLLHNLRLNPAEVRPAVIDGAFSAGFVQVNAPSISTHHVEVLIQLLWAEERVELPTILQVAARPAIPDASPLAPECSGSSVKSCLLYTSPSPRDS
eukprot:TRINITY_DN46898_c0_g1_i1.p1 TRINITY_DN46898_c0_g1~~TRINITY_DN46898_c0_g1_i1.p1  ORF type:complete len:144 (+),score=16.88 TRINITY_DN46898_c0_g1_i1:203-634(+)